MFPADLLGTLAALDPAQRRELATTLRHVADNLAEVKLVSRIRPHTRHRSADGRHRILAGRDVSKSCLRKYSSQLECFGIDEPVATSAAGPEGRARGVHRYCNGDRGARGCPRGCVRRRARAGPVLAVGIPGTHRPGLPRRPRTRRLGPADTHSAASESGCRPPWSRSSVRRSAAWPPPACAAMRICRISVS